MSKRALFSYWMFFFLCFSLAGIWLIVTTNGNGIAKLTWGVLFGMALASPLAKWGVLIGAALAFSRRLRWRSYAWGTWLAWFPFGVLCGALLACPKPPPLIFVFIPLVALAIARRNAEAKMQTPIVSLLLILCGPFFFPIDLRAMAADQHSLLIPEFNQYSTALLAFVSGSVLGGLLAMPVVFLARFFTRSVGFYSWPLAFVWRKGSDSIQVRCPVSVRRLVRRSSNFNVDNFDLRFTECTKSMRHTTGGFENRTMTSYNAHIGYTTHSYSVYTGPVSTFYEDISLGKYGVTLIGLSSTHASCRPIYLRSLAAAEARATVKKIRSSFRKKSSLRNLPT